MNGTNDNILVCESSHHRISALLGVPIDALRMDEVLDICNRTIRQREHLLLGVVNAAKVVNMHRDEVLNQAVRSADMILADGASVVWASRLLRRGLPERVTGIDLMYELLGLADRNGYRVYCLGATDEVLAEVVGRITHDFPGMHLAGSRNGYFTDEEDQAVVEEIRRAKPDMLFVAMSSPKKELFLANWSQRMGVPVCHGVGGAFDVLAGKVKRAPAFWQRAGLEWLYRVIQEPRAACGGVIW